MNFDCTAHDRYYLYRIVHTCVSLESNIMGRNSGFNYSTVQLKLVVKTKFPFISLLFTPPVSHKFPWGEFLWNSFPLFSPFFPDVGVIFPEFPQNSPEIGQFSPEFPRIPPKFTNFPKIFPEFHPISQWFLLIPPDSAVSCAVFTSQV